jgi:amino acid adenylation domain-containing protein
VCAANNWQKSTKETQGNGKNMNNSLLIDPERTVSQTDFSFGISEEMTCRFDEFNRKRGVPLAVSLSALAGVLLQRYIGESCVSLGVRLGTASNFDDLETDLSGYPSVRELLNKVCETMKSKPNLNEILNSAEQDKIEISFPWRLMRPLMKDRIVSECQDGLILQCRRDKSGLHCTLRYETSLYQDELAAQMAGHIKILLKEMIENLDARCTDLQMLSQEEFSKIVYDWNQPELNYEKKCFPELFREQATRSPHATALVCDDQALTYSELDLRSNSVAHYLHQLGTGPEVVIGVGMGRSLDAIIGILGILKTGAAYCAIDPDYPIARREEIAAEAGISFIITNSEYANRFKIKGLQAIVIDDLVKKEETAQDLHYSLTMDNAAYITFTSGSTGKPKGVVGTHRSIAVLCRLCRLPSGKEKGEAGCLNTPLSFSSSISTLLMSVCCGILLVVIPVGKERDPKTLALAVKKHRITNLTMVPSLLRQLFSLGSEGRRMLDSVKMVGLSGAEVTWDLVEPFQQIMPNAKLTAGYASSEICVIAFGSFVDIEGKSKGGRIPLGRPMPGVQVLVLDDNMSPSPIGVPGELYIGSAHLARGYVGQPVLTAERFLPNPFSLSSGARMYRTGDIVRRRFDGELEYLGRTDNQVKIRGFRIELEEIEVVLKNHPEIEDAVVAPEKDEISERLAAFVVMKSGFEIKISQLREYMEQHLPFYMLPARFIVLERLPMTPNGKIDRQTLPSAPLKQITPDVYHEGAHDPIQADLLEIWQISLGLGNIGIHDEFLELGGDSLVAVQIALRIREHFGVEIPVPLFFGDMTIASLADEIRMLQESNEQ